MDRDLLLKLEGEYSTLRQIYIDSRRTFLESSFKLRALKELLARYGITVEDPDESRELPAPSAPDELSFDHHPPENGAAVKVGWRAMIKGILGKGEHLKVPKIVKQMKSEGAVARGKTPLDILVRAELYRLKGDGVVDRDEDGAYFLKN